MLFGDYTLILYLKTGHERGLIKALSPHLAANLPGQIQVYFSFVQITIGFNQMPEISRREHRPGDLFESFPEFFEVARVDRHSSSSRMPAELKQKARVALGNKI